MRRELVLTSQVKYGMIIADDLFSDSGQFVLPRFSIIDKRTIQLLHLYSIRELYITDKPKIRHNTIEQSTIVPVLPKILPDAAANENALSNSVEFKKFANSYHNNLDDFKSELNSIIVDYDFIDTDKLLAQAAVILSHVSAGFNIFTMLHNIKAYDDSTYSHSLNVALISHVFGQWLHLSKSEIEILTISGLLHDIGKLKIDPAIIKKNSSLTDYEFQAIQNHPALGYELMKDAPLDNRIKTAVLMHHEKCDGSGYPNGLLGNEIDDFAKIITIVDIYDAMTSNRIYRKALCPFDVIRLFESESYQKYDTYYILAFLEQIVQAYINSYVLLSNGFKGKIVMINRHDLSRPVVQCKNHYLDLSKDRSVFIKELL